MINKNNTNFLKLDEKTQDDLIKKQYGIYNHSGVQICTWNKKALTQKGVCYKERFYNVDCHSCMQFSPVVMWCQQNCTFCWRPMEYMRNININPQDVDEPQDIVQNLIIERNKLLSGFGGHDNIDLKKLKESKTPTHYAISLSGEPTLYPKLNELVGYLKTLKDTKTIFIVSNGQEPDFFKNLITKPKFAPTQLYVSIDASSEELFKKINYSLYKDGWERLNQTLNHLSQIQTRTVFRMTQIKGLNDLDEHLEGYKSLIEKGKPDIIEVKAYMYIGLSRKRHTQDQMPSWEDVQDFAKKLEKTLPNYKIEGEMKESLILILRKQDSNYNLKISPFENEK